MPKTPKQSRRIQRIWKQKKFTKRTSVYLLSYKHTNEIGEPYYLYRLHIHDRYRSKPLWTTEFHSTPEAAVAEGLALAIKIEAGELFSIVELTSAMERELNNKFVKK